MTQGLSREALHEARLIRLNVNTRQFKAGAIVAEDALSAGFADQLVAAGQAERVADETGARDPVEAVLEQVAELGDQMDAVSVRLGAITTQAGALDADDQVRVADALTAVIEGGASLPSAEALMALLDRARSKPAATPADATDASAPADTAPAAETAPAVKRPVPTKPARKPSTGRPAG